MKFPGEGGHSAWCFRCYRFPFQSNRWPPILQQRPWSSQKGDWNDGRRRWKLREDIGRKDRDVHFLTHYFSPHQVQIKRKAYKTRRGSSLKPPSTKMPVFPAPLNDRLFVSFKSQMYIRFWTSRKCAVKLKGSARPHTYVWSGFGNNWLRKGLLLNAKNMLFRTVPVPTNGLAILSGSGPYYVLKDMIYAYTPAIKFQPN